MNGSIILSQIEKIGGRMIIKSSPRSYNPANHHHPAAHLPLLHFLLNDDQGQMARMILNDSGGHVTA